MSQDNPARETAFLEYLKDRASSAQEAHHSVGACYMACLCGMWTHRLHRPDINPFEESLLYEWFNTGFDASKKAIEANEGLKKRFAKYEKEWLEEQKTKGKTKNH
jgi:hypothetical protein